MAFVLDTSVAIPLRDNDPVIEKNIRALGGPLYFSTLTLVELEGGIYRDADQAVRRRARVDLLLRAIGLLDFNEADARTYGQIVAKAGYSRRKIVDRMIAAQAMVRQATLVTLNAADVKDIADLKLLTL